MATQTQLVECWKCGGTGYIAAFAGIANGVCFTCGGSGKKACKATKRREQPITEWQQQQIDKITNGDLSTLKYSQLNALRDFAHAMAYRVPGLLQTWRERGDEYFFAAQEERLAEFYANQ